MFQSVIVLFQRCLWFVFLMSVLSVNLMSADGQTLATLKSGDRIVFLGDSLTQQGGGRHGYVTMFKEALAENGIDQVEVINAGISGHKVPDLQKRLEKDVLEHKPTHVVIYIGINDVWHSLKGEGRGTKPEVFEAGLRELIAKIASVGAKTILCTPSVIGEKKAGTNGLDVMLDEFSDISRKVAAETEVSLLDLRNAFVEHLAEVNTYNEGKGVLTTDGVHFTGRGNRFVADQMLKAFGVPVDGVADGSQLRHVVLFQFKDSVREEEIEKIVKAFSALPKKIESITGFEYGVDISTENLAQGFTHCFIVSFTDAAGRDAYLPHPAHKEFVTLINGKIEKVLVFDFMVIR